MRTPKNVFKAKINSILLEFEYSNSKNIELILKAIIYIKW